MNKSLSRSIGFWLLLVVSLAATAVGGWLVSGQIGSMSAKILDQTATGVDVYVGPSIIVVGTGVLTAGIIGVLLSLALVAARALVPTPAPAVVEAIDWTVEAEENQVPVGTAQASDVAADADVDAATNTAVTNAAADTKGVAAETDETAPTITRN
ncbi:MULTISPECIES: hypothetical protein [unclassified Microbacterium]|uniref:hypothetical protein n=1 Tax=unclassified Microbacterium TaxID=2609290 RepID=UPI002158979F|nr:MULTISPECIES: hypothetical protein [unclassified Microbacterium]